MVILGLAFSFFRFRKNLPYRVDSSFSGNPSILLSLNDVEIIGRANGERVWSFKANRADIAQGRVQTALHGLHDGKIYEDRKVAATVTAGKAVFMPGSGDVEVTEGVKVASSKGFTVTADKVTWSGFYKQLMCPGKVVFSAGGSKLIGQKLFADLKQQSVTMENGKMCVSVLDLEKLESKDSQPKEGQRL